MKSPKIIQDEKGRTLIERFSPIRRFEHIFTILTFVVLLLTGFPQKFYDHDLAAYVLSLLGGLDNARMAHRVAGVLFAVHAGLHLLAIVVGVLLRRMELSMLPSLRDLKDARDNVLYCLGARPEPPDFPKFDYRQKFEYFGIVLGGMVMISTGLILMYPMLASHILPGDLILASRVAHSNEAMLAFLVLLIWHVYGSHLSPEIYPMDKTMFTGFITADELEERHRGEFKRLFPGRPLLTTDPQAHEDLDDDDEAPPAKD